LVPLYIENFAVQRALTQIASEGDESPAGIKKSLESRWAIEDIKSLDFKDVVITKMGAGTQVRAEYRAETPFVANVSIVVDFDKSVMIGSGSKF
jgi:predicted lipid carrier protein YhbT